MHAELTIESLKTAINAILILNFAARNFLQNDSSNNLAIDITIAIVADIAVRPPQRASL